MKRLIYPLASLSILLFACNISTILTPSGGTAAPVVTEPPVVNTAPAATETPVPATNTPPATETPVPAPNTPSGPQANVICNELSLSLDPALATGFTCQTIPELSGPDVPPWGVNPQYTEVLLDGYVLSGHFFTPHIDIFPIQRFSELFPETIDQRVAALQSLIGGGAPVDGSLPV